MSHGSQTLKLFADTLDLQVEITGSGRQFLLLHGGAGPASMAGLAGTLGARHQVVTPTHPGFLGHARPEWFNRIADLATAYLTLIERLDLTDVTLVGNSVGGWIGAEMALRRSPRIGRLVLLNAVGIDTETLANPILDPMVLAPAERGAASFHDPARFAFAPAGPEAAAAMAENQKTLRVYAGLPFMHDPALRGRLSGMLVPTLVAWGASDRIVDLDYGRLYAASVPDARFQVIEQAGHFPQIEQLDIVAGLIEEFAAP